MCVNFSQFLLKNDPPGPGPSDEKIKKKKPSFPWRLVKRIDFENFLQKIVESCRKNIKQIGQFCVTLIWYWNLRQNCLILIVKSFKSWSRVEKCKNSKGFIRPHLSFFRHIIRPKSRWSLRITSFERCLGVKKRPFWRGVGVFFWDRPLLVVI